MGEVGDIILFEARKIKYAENEWDVIGEYRSPYVKIGAFDLLNVPLKKKGNKFNGPFSENQNSVRADRVLQSLDDCEVQNLLPQARQLCGEFPLNLYPNPAHESIFLEQAIESYTSVKVYDLKGKLVHTQNTYEPSLGIPTTHLVSGLYLVVAKRGEATFRQKLLVSH